MPEFDPGAYGPAVAGLLKSEPLCDLGPGKPDSSQRAALQSLTPATLLAGQTIRDSAMAKCCLAGLWLLFDYLEESHVISQDIETPSGSYWHAIMHRREPDFGNSKYWFRRVGTHEVFEPLRIAAREIATATGSEAYLRSARFLTEQTAWDPYRFTDLCEMARQTPQLAPLCRFVARAEWRLLFDFCYRRSIV